jgi:hypothetical protein
MPLYRSTFYSNEFVDRFAPIVPVDDVQPEYSTYNEEEEEEEDVCSSNCETVTNS